MINKAARGAYWAYMVECKYGTYYAGWTNDLKKRIAAHNNGTGAKYLRGKGPVRLVYKKKYSTVQKAQAQERLLKSLTRQEKKALMMNFLLTLSILFFTFASPAFAAITIVQHTNNDAWPTSVLDVGLHQNTGSRNLLVVMIMMYPANYSVVSVSDGYNFFTAVPNAVSLDSGTGQRTEAWYLPYSTSGANTIEVIFSGIVTNFTSMEVWEVSGYKSPVVDMASGVQNGLQGIPNPGATGAAVTTTQAAEFIAACDESDANAETSTNFTSGGEQDGGDNDYASLITTTPGTYQALWPNDGGTTFASSTVAFKDMPGSGFGGVVKINNGKIGF